MSHGQPSAIESNTNDTINTMDGKSLATPGRRMALGRISLRALQLLLRKSRLGVELQRLHSLSLTAAADGDVIVVMDEPVEDPPEPPQTVIVVGVSDSSLLAQVEVSTLRDSDARIFRMKVAPRIVDGLNHREQLLADPSAVVRLLGNGAVTQDGSRPRPGMRGPHLRTRTGSGHGLGPLASGR